MIKRVVLIVLDSVGVGELPDAHLFGDEGSNTVGNIYRDVEGFELPNMEKLGLLDVESLKQYKKNDVEILGSYARSLEKSMGKDTTTGHWEMSGVVLPKAFPTYPNGFPADVIKAFEEETGRKAIGNCVASGTEIIKELGEEHMRDGSLIVYTSADSVFQIAAHEEIVPLEELYKACEIARKILVGDHAVGRVIARPFITEDGAFVRTKNRKDFSLEPIKDTMLDYLDRAGKTTFAIGKIEDIFAQKGINRKDHTTNNNDGIEVTIKAMKENFEGLIFTNLVDFDMVYGHRNNVQGYADALKYFDDKLPEIMDNMTDEDLLIITADHGCDPTTPSTDHSREYIPVLMYGKDIKANNHLETFDTYANIGKTILDIFDIENELDGVSVKDKIMK